MQPRLQSLHPQTFFTGSMRLVFIQSHQSTLTILVSTGITNVYWSCNNTWLSHDPSQKLLSSPSLLSLLTYQLDSTSVLVLQQSTTNVVLLKKEKKKTKKKTKKKQKKTTTIYSLTALQIWNLVCVSWIRIKASARLFLFYRFHIRSGFFCLFKVLQSTCIPWLVVPSSLQAQQWLVELPSHPILLTYSAASLSHFLGLFCLHWTHLENSGSSTYF